MAGEMKALPPVAADLAPRRLTTRELFAGGGNEIRIDHEGLEYRLRITKQNRLILYR
jgi:hemin uptake protein HemP